MENKQKTLHVPHPHVGLAYNLKSCTLNTFKYCTKQFEHKHNLHRHIKSAHENKKNPCAKCDNFFSRNEDLMAHIKKITRLFHVKCAKCPLMEKKCLISTSN